MKKKIPLNINKQNIEKLLKILVCPKTGSSLKYDKANLAYPIRNKIPILIEKEARKINKR